MRTLYEQIEELYINHIEDYDYYERLTRTDFDRLCSNEFITQYFSNGGKESVILQFINEIEEMRSMHMMSAFFMGILLKEKLCPRLEIESCYPENYRFTYIWFLVCLFHDIGYVQENDWTQKYVYQRKAENDLNNSDTIRKKAQGWQRRWDGIDLGVLFITKPVFSELSCRVGERNYERINGIRFNNGIRINRSVYKKNTILNYLEFCKMNLKHYDHGIVGGFWLYDSLYRNYCNKYDLQCRIDGNAFFDDFEWNGLHFSKEQHYVFSYVADCIISHNMWPATESTNELYRKCGLDELTIEQFIRIRFVDNPILYILALIDTIEPIKIYDGIGLSRIEVWKGIEIKFESDSIRIKVVDKRMPFERITKKITGLDKWIEVEYFVNSVLNEIEIRIYGM